MEVFKEILAAVLAAAEVASKVGKAGADGAQKMARGATGDEEQ